MKKSLTAYALTTAVAAAMLLTAPAAYGGDAVAGEQKAHSCIQCHGAGGAAPIADYPILAGQYERYLLQTLRDYRAGRRNAPMMTPMLDGLDDDDFKDLAAYFAAQPGPLR